MKNSFTVFKTVLPILLFFIIRTIVYSQKDWIIYNTSNSNISSNDIVSLAIDSLGNKWICTVNSTGLIKFDGKTWTKYNTNNSNIPDNSLFIVAIDKSGYFWIGAADGIIEFDGTNWILYSNTNPLYPFYNTYANVQSIAFDNIGNKWFGFYPAEIGSGGLIKFDGTNWTLYNTDNSNIPSNNIYAIVIDSQSKKWIGSDNGLANFSLNSWTVYNTSNSKLPDNIVMSIAIDSSENKWVGTQGGLAEFDGTNWNVYNISNSNIPSNYVSAIAIDSSGNKWIGTYSGLAKFDGTNWTIYSTLNSELSYGISTICIDANGNKWIGTNGDGLIEFNENGIASSINNIQNRNSEINIYPNPANDIINIDLNKINNESLRVDIFNVIGENIYSENINTPNLSNRVNVSGLSDGVYILKLQTGDITNNTKIIIRH